MILAAGRGERMRPLTDQCPKPLLKVGNQPLIGHHLNRLREAGFKDIVINHAWLGHQIETTLADGSDYGVHIHYSAEQPGGLETAGGIATALPLLGEQPFLVINGDVLTDIDFNSVAEHAQQMQMRGDLAYLWLVNNPAHHTQGDFSLTASQRVSAQYISAATWTFSGIGIYHPALFADIAPHTRAKLAPVLRQAMNKNKVGGIKHEGRWLDVGTVERLKQANEWVEAGLC